MRLGAKFIVALVTLTAMAQTSANALPYDPSVVRQLRQQGFGGSNCGFST